MTSEQFNTSATILIVDDVPENLRLLSAALTSQDYRVRPAKSGSMALMSVLACPPDLVLLDINMPDMNGYDVCAQIKSNPLTATIPIIFFSVNDAVVDKVKAFEVGGSDYVLKPFHVDEVLARVKHQLMLRNAHQEIHRLNSALEQRVQQRTMELELANQELTYEVAERKRAQEQLVYDALHDSLTGLPNRNLFLERAQTVLDRLATEPLGKFAVLFIDLDRFKIINDSLGHMVGDRLLVAIAKLLANCLRPCDTVARLGGDEFTILLSNIQTEGDAIAIAERIQSELDAPFDVEGHTVFTSASIGIAFGAETYGETVDLLRDADIAMYHAKEQGKARYAIFDPCMYQRTLQLLQLERDLRKAIENHEFILYYQPIVSLVTGQIAGFEALIRWQHPERGFISPQEFIPIAEDTGLIVPLGDWVLREACQQLKQWQETLPAAEHLRVSVNLASKQIQESDFIEKVDRVLAETGLDGQFLRLELTESMLMERTNEIIEMLTQVRHRHILLSIDDFGTGYSSLSYLHRFPVSTLKIDRSFVTQMTIDNESFEIARTVVTLAHALSLDVIAEGVETPEQVTQLRRLGCEFGQGYLFSKPLSTAAIEALITTPDQVRRIQELVSGRSEAIVTVNV
jgi:diguanylate cyclase (GGDEF)-like protein